MKNTEVPYGLILPVIQVMCAYLLKLKVIRETLQFRPMATITYLQILPVDECTVLHVASTFSVLNKEAL